MPHPLCSPRPGAGRLGQAQPSSASRPGSRGQQQHERPPRPTGVNASRPAPLAPDGLRHFQNNMRIESRPNAAAAQKGREKAAGRVKHQKLRCVRARAALQGGRERRGRLRASQGQAGKETGKPPLARAVAAQRVVPAVARPTVPGHAPVRRANAPFPHPQPAEAERGFRPQNTPNTPLLWIDRSMGGGLNHMHRRVPPGLGPSQKPAAGAREAAGGLSKRRSRLKRRGWASAWWWRWWWMGAGLGELRGPV